MMKYCWIYVILVLLVVPPGSYAADQHAEANTSASSVDVPVTLILTKRSIAGTIITDPQGISSTRATTESLGLDSSTSFQFAASVRWKKWDFGFTYLPSFFSGTGYAEERLDLGDGNYIEPNIQVKTDLEVELYLGSVLYNFLNWKGFEFGAGFGAGAANYNLDIIPRLGPGGLQAHGTTPFGYLSFSAVWGIGNFQFSGRVDGLDLSYGSSEVGYKDLSFIGGYRIPYKKVPIFIQAGYRWNSLDLIVDDTLSRFGLDVEFQGPFIAATVVF